MMTRTFNVLDPSESIGGIHFLEASAGTGKTFTLTHVVARLLFEPEFELSFSKIALVTFTQAACAELKKRTKDLLLRLEADPLFLNLFEIDQKKAQLKIKQALEAFDEAPIFTIHGLCFALLQKIAPSCGLVLKNQNPEEISLDDLCFDFIKKCLIDPSLNLLLSAPQKRALLSKERGDFQKLILKTKDKVLSGLPIEPVLSFCELKQKFETLLSTLPPCLEKQALLDFVASYKLSPLTQADVEEQIENLESVLQNKKPIETCFVRRSFLENLNEENLKKGKSTPSSHPAFVFIESLKKEFLPLVKKAMDPASLELLFVNFCKPGFEALLEKKNLLSFQNLLLKLDQALEDPSIAKLLGSAFDAFIIDEFQDTDALQWSIFKKLLSNSSVKAFYMIGDPKQAIYAFRAADVYTYLKAKEDLPGLRVSDLATSYRQEPPLMEALNLFFLKTPWIELPYIDKKLAYRSIHSGCKTSTPLFHTPLVFYPIDLELEEGEISCVNLGLKLLASYPEDRVAFLVKDRFQAGRIEQLLKKQGCPLTLIKSESLEDSFLSPLLETFILFLHEGSTLRARNRFLSSEWFDYPLETFYQELDRFESLFQKIQTTFEEKGFLPSLETLFDLTWPGYSCAHRFEMTAWYGEGIIDKLIHIAKQIEGPKVPANLLLNLFALKKSKAAVPQMPSSQARCILMTSHMSKGLEFDHVIALGTSTRSLNKPQILLKKNEKGLYYGLADESPSSQKAFEEIDAEKMRQLYVALTRAKKSVHLPLFNYDKETLCLGTLSPFEYFLSRVELSNASHQNLYAHFSQDSFAQFKTILDKHFDASLFSQSGLPSENSTYETALASCYLNKSKPIPLKTEGSTLSFSSLKKSQGHFTPQASPLKGKEYGDFFHLLMEDLLERGLYQKSFEDPLFDRIKEKIALSCYKDHELLIFEHIEHALSAPLSWRGEVFTIRDLEPQNLFIEEAFLYPLENHSIRGFIDLVFSYKGHLFFVDWKTSTLEHSDEKALLKHMEESEYLLQLSLYEAALRKRLTFFKAQALGAAFYIFVKSKGVFTKIYDEALL